jgi:hypothetical protein
MMNASRFLGFCKVFAAAVFSLAIVGGVRNYSPIPYWDMWDGTLGFYMQVMDGNPASWWAQHNEHRIVLARILFWIDYQLFGGRSIFLILMNYVFAGLSSWVFWRFLYLISSRQFPKEDYRPMGFIVIAMMFFWSQNGNFSWGFQGQFFLAQLLPLSALLFLAMSQDDQSLKYHFTIACLLGALSAGSMANGIVALPLMCVYSLIMRMGVQRSLVLLVMSIAVNFAYLYDYHSPEIHGKVLGSILNSPVATLEFFIIYLGNPFGFLGQSFSFHVGLVVLFFCLKVILREIALGLKSPFRLALIVFIIYLLAAALGTAGGRVNFGLEAARSSRYTTPTLMLMAALLILFQEKIRFPDVLKFRNVKRWAPIAVVGALMLVHQVGAVSSARQTNFPREVAALALSLGIHDDEYIRNLYPNTHVPLRLASIAVERGYSVFGMAPFAHIKDRLGSALNLEGSRRCIGNLDSIENINSVDGFLRVRGWIYDPAVNSVPSFIEMTDGGGNVAGFAMTGEPRPDVTSAVSGKPKNAGFTGYVVVGVAGSIITIAAQDSSCILSAHMPALPNNSQTYHQ